METHESLREVENLRFRFQMNNRLRLESLAAVSKVFREFGEPITDELLAGIVFALPRELVSNNGHTYAQAEQVAGAPPDSTWQPGAPPDSTWQPGAPPDSTWQPGAPPDSTWQAGAPPDSPQKPGGFPPDSPQKPGGFPPDSPQKPGGFPPDSPQKPGGFPPDSPYKKDATVA